MRDLFQVSGSNEEGPSLPRGLPDGGGQIHFTKCKLRRTESISLKGLTEAKKSPLSNDCGKKHNRKASFHVIAKLKTEGSAISGVEPRN